MDDPEFFAVEPVYWIHHDGSEFYVPNQKPKLGDKVKLRVRIHDSMGKLQSVKLRSVDSGEPFFSEPAKVIKDVDRWSFYELVLPMHNPQMHYRFALEFKNDRFWWLNAHGVSELDQPDVLDFRINTFSSAPAWGPETVMYQIFPDRFARSAKADSHKKPDWAIPAKWTDEVKGSGPGTGQQFFGGDLWGVIEHLDHLKNLGVTMIYLTPIFPGGSNHRYDASSFDEVDPLLGGNEALAALTKAAHDMGFKIIGDLTTNHSGDRHEWFKASFKKPKAVESDFYYFSKNNTVYDAWLGVKTLPKFNWKSQELRKRFIEGKTSVVAKWLKAPFNFDGWRIDVANMTGRIREEDAYAEVANTIRKTMVDINPNTIMLGEYTADAAYEVQGDGWQGAMTYANFTKPLWRWLWNPKNKLEAGFIGRPTGQIGGHAFATTHTAFAAAFPWHVRLNNMNPLDTHDIPRFKTFTVPGAQLVGATAQFTFPGIPVIWAGDEFGLDGWNGENSRTPLPWNNERPHDKSMMQVYTDLAAIRKANPALRTGSFRFVSSSSEQVVYVRETKSQTILVALSRKKVDWQKFPTDLLGGFKKAERLFGTAELVIGKTTSKLKMNKVSVGIWRLSR